jgi:hemerythrin
MFTPLIEWNQANHCIGIDIIDQQHEQLADYINLLAQSIENGKSKDIIQQLFQKLHDYTIYHFTAEEVYFDQLNDADLELHKLHHKHFIEELSRIKQLDQSLISQDLLFFLTDWFINHILGEDTKLLKSSEFSIA